MAAPSGSTQWLAAPSLSGGSGSAATLSRLSRAQTHAKAGRVQQGWRAAVAGGTVASPPPPGGGAGPGGSSHAACSRRAQSSAALQPSLAWNREEKALFLEQESPPFVDVLAAVSWKKGAVSEQENLPFVDVLAAVSWKKGAVLDQERPPFLTVLLSHG